MDIKAVMFSANMFFKDFLNKKHGQNKKVWCTNSYIVIEIQARKKNNLACEWKERKSRWN